MGSHEEKANSLGSGVPSCTTSEPCSEISGGSDTESANESCSSNFETAESMPPQLTTAPQPSNLNMQCLEKEVAALQDHAANLRLAAMRAREAANVAVAPPQL